MSERWISRTGLLAVLAAAALAIEIGVPCAAEAQEPAPPAEEAEEKVPPSLLGPVTREEIEAAEPSWVAALIEAAPDFETALALAEVPPGAEVVVYFGTWCSDSRRELPRLWRALDESGGLVPFEIEYVAVDRGEQRPPELKSELDLRYVPTFIVRRGGEEVGRMVEESPGGIEHDLLALLSGEATGTISARDDLGGEASGEPGGEPAP
jgi:thiol-disulfide isomerase/thioredoxin